MFLDLSKKLYINNITVSTKNLITMTFKNDYDDLMGDYEWEQSEIDSGYFDSDNEAGNPGSS